MHHRSPTGNMQFTVPHSYQYCTQICTLFSDYDHFLACRKPIPNKEKKIENLDVTIKKLKDTDVNLKTDSRKCVKVL